MKTLFTAFVCLYASLSVANPTLPIPNQNGFDSANSAAKDALEHISEMKQEYAGVIYYYNKHYYYTNPVTSGDSTKVHDIQIFIPHGSKLIALYHNHPSAAFSRYFSQEDCDTAEQMNINSYIIVDNTVYLFVPHKDHRTMIRGVLSGVALGTKIS